jgi:hypothetical protein
MEKIRTQFDDVRPIPRVAVRVWLADGTRRSECGPGPDGGAARVRYIL